MRMRKKTNLVPRMEACAQYWIQEPETYKGRWRELMPQCRELRVEVGCGNAIAQQRGKLGIVPDRLGCDYYDWCDGKRMGILWQGEYMV